ncbi:TraB/GumN family protein [Kangiella sediminilitoris]|uniref:GumN family protein n=1 Tax=Kangiella sediminilitoris TaxID=1144748 RepID=A0A1B3BDV5_9GAMM|nr:TraB/GumN family protein [Kangiella sediminilitoris]AOE50948.1 GumN family protein [Kangiella sediminilitoris]
MNKILGIVLAGLIGMIGCSNEPTNNKDLDVSKATKSVETKQSDENQHNSKPDVKSEITDESVNTDYTPALWKIEHNGTTSYLFGSIHMGEADMYPLPDAVNKAFSASDSIAVEIDLSSINQAELAQTIQSIAIDPENPLNTVLKEETLAEYEEYCEETKSPCQMFNSFEPWFAGMTLEALSMQQSGYSEQYGIDNYFLGQAKDKNKNIIELESIDFQLSLFDQMPLELQDMFLYSVVTKEGNDTDELVSAWKQGNVEEFIANSYEDAKQKGMDEEAYEQFMDALLYQRNRGMADGIAEQIEQGKALFAVVGAAHYGGDKSVNHYLEEKGYKVERVDY